MSTNEMVEVLNDLVQINNDRIVGYQKAIEELKDDADADLKAIFGNMVLESERCNNELSEAIREMGGTPTDSTTVAGKLYRVWMDVKAAFTSGSREAVLENCVGGEAAAQKAYESALEEDELNSSVREMLIKQKNTLSASYNRVQQLEKMAS